VGRHATLILTRNSEDHCGWGQIEEVMNGSSYYSGRTMLGWPQAGGCVLGCVCVSLLLAAAPASDLQFTDITQASGIDFRHENSATSNKYLVETMGGGVALLDYDSDGRLDVFFANGAKIDDPMPLATLPDKSARIFWNRLYHQNPDGTFADVSSKAGIANPRGKGLGVSFADFDADGFMDVYVANDSVQSFLYRNNGNGTFAEVGLLAGVGYNEDGKTFAGMGVDFADYDNDGHPDVFVTDLSNERYRLFRHNGDGTFRDVTNPSGIGGATLPFAGWSTHFLDYDNDGWKDIFVVQGHVMDTIEKTSPHLRYRQPPLLLRNESARFVRVSPGAVFQTDWAGRGAAFGDLDNDGDVDVVMSNVGENAVVLRNDGGNRKNWLGIRTVGSRSNRDGIGCRVKVVSPSGLSQYFTVNTAAGYLSASDKRIVVGLDRDSTATLVEIRWPSGAVQRFEHVKAGQMLVASEPPTPTGASAAGPCASPPSRESPGSWPGRRC
jgi:hypothetical protein